MKNTGCLGICISVDEGSIFTMMVKYNNKEVNDEEDR